MTISMAFSCGDGVDIRECELPQGDEVTETGRVIGVEFKVAFGPIEHPLEPTDEDHPVKCPMSNSSVLSDGERPKEQTAESLRKIAEFTVADEEGMVAGPQPLAHPVRKRHQTLHRDRGRPPLSMVPQRSVLQVFAELNEFEP
eukprot:TRINITY_DN48119_c0_g1_i2.p1 TRINITY_DN48119_c0_g1~~TRINITY_DN48119_c0_g1_i2.p1  ORF type:complete len:143 (-),score=34.38 TRINITY_DN48119_c0_g1_i2:94-522(-)